MNRFRKMGFVEYNGRIRVHNSLLNVVLHDQLPEHNAKRPPIQDPAGPLKAGQAKVAGGSGVSKMGQTNSTQH
jgi:CRP/FNR family cyclic AMP-dependent transcriptional regulator